MPGSSLWTLRQGRALEPSGHSTLRVYWPRFRSTTRSCSPSTPRPTDRIHRSPQMPSPSDDIISGGYAYEFEYSQEVERVQKEEQNRRLIDEAQTYAENLIRR